MWPLRFTRLLVLSVVLLLPSLALACSCLSEPEIFPKKGAIPPNVVFHAMLWADTPLLLVDAAGARIPLRREESGNHLVMLHPSTLLEDGKRYTLVWDAPQAVKMPPLASYTVRGEPDATPPRPPSSTDFDYERSETLRGLVSRPCGFEHEGYTVRSQGASDDRTSGEQLAILAVSASNPDEVLAMLPPGQSYLGQDGCFYNFDVALFAGTQVALRSVDLAGNRSAPGPALTLPKRMPLALAMLLQTTPGRALIILLLTLLLGSLLLVARRSTRQTRP